MNNLKRSFARSLIDPSLSKSILLSGVIFSGIAINGEKFEYEIDNYSTPETVSEVRELKEDLSEIQEVFSNAQKKLAVAEEVEETSREPVSVIYSDYNQEIEYLQKDIAKFEYDILSSGISEKDMHNIITEYNGHKLSEHFPIIPEKNIATVNDHIKNTNNPALLNQTLANRQEYINTIKEKSSKSIENSENEVPQLIAVILASMLFGSLFWSIRGIFSERFNTSKKLKEWSDLDKEESKFLKKISPKNIIDKAKQPKKKKLSISAKGNKKL